MADYSGGDNGSGGNGGSYSGGGPWRQQGRSATPPEERMRLQELMAMKIQAQKAVEGEPVPDALEDVEEPDEGPPPAGAEPDVIERYLMAVLRSALSEREVSAEDGYAPNKAFAGESGLVDNGSEEAKAYALVDGAYDENREELRRASVGPSRRPRFI